MGSDRRFADDEIYRLLFEGLPTGLVLLDDQGRVAAANPPAREALDALHRGERQASIDALACGVAHDFDELLEAIEERAWTLLKQLDAGDALRRPAEDIQQICARACASIRRLLKENRRRAERCGPLQLNDILAAMECSLKRILGQSIDLITDLDPALPAIRAPQQHVEQAVLHLAQNAGQAMPAGGALTIRTQRLELPAIDASWHAPCGPGEFAQLSLSDTGPGMDATLLAQVFRPFFTTRGSEGGSGLGLSTVRAIAADTGGGVRVRARPERGTTFELVFPASAGDPTIPSTTQPTENVS